MKVLVDTSVWSLALRRARRPVDRVAAQLAELIQEGRVVMIGAIRQELLSGIKDGRQFEELRERLQAFPDLKLTEADYEQAAAFFNTCRARGIQGSNTDFLICAVAAQRGLSIFTTDGDFGHFKRVLQLELHPVRK